MSKAEETSAESVQAPPKAFTGKVSFHGFQVFATQDAGDADENSSISLQLELKARAERFRDAVDESIVLSSDGVIRWLGEPVACLSAGADLFSPGINVFADGRLSEASTELIAKRLSLWILTVIKRLLGPLMALRDLNEEPDTVRQIGRQISDALGMLPRELIRQEVKALDQRARSTLRKHGVRFGAYHVYVPTTLKPASRTLALQLWGLRSNRDDTAVIVQTLASLAASGRTSLPFDANLGVEAYRVAGFRRCGDRLVRADIVERLADLIRATFSSATPAPEKSGFEITTQMTSLTGCSGEGFASILRSLGFESQEIRYSDPPRRTDPSVEDGKAPSPGEPAHDLGVGGPSIDDAALGNAEHESPPGLLSPFHPKEEATFVDGEATKAGEASTEGLQASADSDRLVVIWRPVRRIRDRSPIGRPRRVGNVVELPVSQGSELPASVRTSKLGHRIKRTDADFRGKKHGSSSPLHGNRPPVADERAGDADRVYSGSFDANSPFAKLAELRTLLLQNEKRRG